MSGSLNDKKIEELLAKAVEKETPDILDDLMAEIGIEDKPPVMMKDMLSGGEEIHYENRTVRKTGWKTWQKSLAGLAAAAVLIVAGLTYFRNTPQETFAVVGIDVNPSIEISIDENEMVTEVKAVNEDGEDILKDVDPKGTDVNTACYAIVGSMLAKGYLTDLSNSILLSVRSSDTERSRTIEKEISANLNSYLENSEVAPAILGQYVEDDDELEDFAEKYGISLGKAWLIRNLLESGDPRLNEDSLTKLSTQELILLGQEKNVPSEDSYGKADTSKYITKDEALDTALKASGIERSGAELTGVEFECEDGTIIYEVEFVAGGTEYEYDIDAVTGAVLASEKETEDGSSDDNDEDRDDDDDEEDD